MLYKYLSELFYQPMEIGFIVRSTLLGRKLSHREVKSLAEGDRYL